MMLMIPLFILGACGFLWGPWAGACVEYLATANYDAIRRCFGDS